MYMKITKYGHCCLLIETGERRILTDPGGFSHGFTELTELDLILITHEHPDHLHTDSLKALLENNPSASVVCNASVGKIIAEQGISFRELPDQKVITVAGITLKAYDGPHVEIIGDYGLVQNTGFLVDQAFFYPGDAYTVPDESVNLLALPVAGPWCKVSEAIQYALAVQPDTAIPVHDAGLSEEGKSVTYPHFHRELNAAHITFVELSETETIDLSE